jgi:hypothetical protein
MLNKVRRTEGPARRAVTTMAAAAIDGPESRQEPPLDAYLVDTLMADLVGHDRQPSAFLVYLLLWRRTHGAGKASVQVSLLDLAGATGLSKRAVQDAIRWLSKRRLLSLQRASITAVPVYTVRRPWVR